MVRGILRWDQSGMVSILVFVELALDEQTSECCLAGGRVSILVFVELALDALDGSPAGSFTNVPTGFNPCFRGTCS